MGFSSSEAAWCFNREVRRKRAMCYRPRRRHFPLDGFWRPGPDDVAPALVSMGNAIEAEVMECAMRSAGEALAASEEKAALEDSKRDEKAAMSAA